MCSCVDFFSSGMARGHHLFHSGHNLLTNTPNCGNGELQIIYVSDLLSISFGYQGMNVFVSIKEIGYNILIKLKITYPCLHESHTEYLKWVNR